MMKLYGKRFVCFLLVLTMLVCLVASGDEETVSDTSSQSADNTQSDVSEDADAQYYIDYLTEKYSKLYDL